MEKIPYDLILDIQKKVNIVDVISEYLPLEQRGKNYFAICPFHDDHNPSLSISSEKQIYTCFVCGASGNVFNFVMDYEKISFIEAVVKIANKVGISLDYNVSLNKPKKENPNSKYFKIFDIACKYYQNNIKSVYGKKAISYLHDRNLDDDIIKEFGIGLSMDDNNISKLLINKGFSEMELCDIGISGAHDNFLYDTFRNRIMFPLSDSEGNIVGFSGRIYNGENESKYVNSKESVIFKKGKILYNYKKAFDYAKKEHQIIIVEGFMDVIRLYTIGIKNVVATMGTAITKEHADLIRRLSLNVVLCFDGDKAGKKATDSAIEALEKIGIVPKIIRLEDNLDPDDYIIKKGKDAYLTHLKNPMDLITYKLEDEKENINFNDFGDISNYLNNVTKELEKINDKVVYELTVKKISKETGVDIDTINSMVNNIPKKENKIIEKRVVTKKNKFEKAEEYLIYYMLKDINVIKLYEEKVSFLTNKNLSRLAMEILEFYYKNGYINITDLTLFLQDKKELINEALRIDEFNLPDLANKEVILDYIKTIEDGILKNEIDKLKLKIKEETNVAKKIVLLEKLRVLKKKECK